MANLRLDIANAYNKRVEQRKKKEEEEIPSLKPASTLSDSDKKIISTYESLPDYNAFQSVADYMIERINPTYDKGDQRKTDFNKKQSMVNEYNAAKERQITSALDNYQAKDSNTIPMLAGSGANALLHPFRYDAARKEIEPYLKENGITFDQLENYYRTQALREQNKSMAENASDNPIKNTLASFATNQIGNAETAIDALAARLSGKPIGENTAVNEYAQLTGAIRGDITKDIKDNASNKVAGEIGAGAYNVLTGLGDMGMSMALTGFNPSGSLALMSTNAGANTLAEQKEKDTTTTQKIATAVMSGAIEALTEKIPLDNLFRLANNPAGKQTAKQIFFNVLGQMASEGSEEVVSEIANNVVDNFFNEKESNYQQRIANYVAQGMSQDEATRMAMNDVKNDAIYAGVIGALSGGVMAGGASVISNRNANANGNSRQDVTSLEDPFGLLNNEQYSLPQLRNGNDWIQERQGVQDFTATSNLFPELKNVNDLMVNNRLGLDEAMQGYNPSDRGALRDINGNRINESTIPWTEQVNFLGRNLDENNIERVANERGWETEWGGEQEFAPNKTNVSDADLQELYDQANFFVAQYKATGNPVFLGTAESVAQRINAINRQNQAQVPALDTESEWDNDIFTNQNTQQTRQSIPEVEQNVTATEEQQSVPTLETAENQELAELENKYRMFMNQYQQNNDPIALKVAEAIQTRINNIVGNRQTNSIPTLNEQTKNAPEIEIDIPQLQEQKPKRQRDKVMKEDYGLNPRTTMEEDADLDLDDDSNELVIDIGMSDDDADAVSQVATNTFMNNIDEFQSPEAQEILQEDIENGVYDKANLNERNYGQNVMHNEWLDNKSDDWIQNHADELEQRIANGEAVYDRSILQAGIKMAKEAATNGDWDRFRYLNQKIASSGNNAGSILNVFAQESARDAATAAVKTDALIRDANDRYFKKHKKQREGCSRLATALKNIGNDYTQIKAKPIPTYDQILRGVNAELGRESSSVFDNFNDQDKAYIANMVQKGYSAKELQLKLEQRLTTGHWDISDADLDRVNSLLEEARQYDDKSKMAAKLDAQACAILAEYLPNTSFYEKWNAWRYLAMLGNPRTHMRNVLGNMMFGQVLETTSDKVGAIIEGVGQGLGVIDKSQRTKTLRTASRSFKQAAKADLMEHAYTDLTDEGNKYSNLKKGIAGQQKVFGNKNAFQRGMSKVNDVAGGLLTFEDERALIRKYDQAVTNFLMSRGYNESIFNATDEKSQAVLEQAREYGIRRAKEATFHEDSKFANWWNQTSKNAHESESIAANLGGYVMDSLMPFVKTPANVLKMSMKYTPANVLNALYNAKNPTKAIEEIARAMTGSSIIALGMFLRSHGMLRTRGDDDEKQLDKVTGQQDFSLNVNGKSYTLDWLSPAAVPLFIGSELYQQYVENEDLDVGKVLEAVADPVTEMSMLQGINNTIEAIAKNRQQETPAGQLLADIGFGYASQAIPTLAGQVARTFDNTRRNSYYTGKEGTEDQFGQYAKKAAAKIPGLSSTLEPFVDAWGQEDKNNDIDNFWGRMLLNTLSPGYYSNIESDVTEQELYRLNKATNGAVKNNLPKMAESKPLDGMDKLSAQDYTEWSKISGQNQKELYDEAIKSSYYKSLNDAEKNSMLTQIRNFSKALSLDEFTEGKDLNGLEYNIEDKSDYKKQYEAYKRNGVQGLVDYIELSDKIKKAYKGDGRTSASKADVINALDSMNDISQEDKIEYLKLKKDYTKRGQYIDQFINPKYAYDWFRVEAMAGDKKDDRMYAIYTMDIPDLEKQVLLSVLNMKDDEIQYHLTTGK